MTTGIIVGEGNSGTTNEYLSNKLNKTGRAGGKIGIGRSNKLGVSKVCNPEHDHNNTTGRQVHNPERANNSTHSNDSIQSNNRETMKKGKLKNRAEDRLEEIISEKKSIPVIWREVKKEAVKKNLNKIETMKNLLPPKFG